MPTIEEAQIRGFLTAKRIKLPHIDRTIELPDDIILKKQGCGNIILEDINGISSFKESKEDSFSWTAIVYFAGSKKWATITQHRELMKYKEHWLDGRYLKVIDDSCIQHYHLKNGDYLLFSHVDSADNEHWGDSTYKEGHYYGGKAHNKNMFELMPEGFVPPKVSVFPVLKKFPERGVCWNPTPELKSYLEKNRQYSSGIIKGYRGIAWNLDSVWGVTSSSSQSLYDISQLQPFITTPVEPSKIGWGYFKAPTIDNFEIGRYYYVRFIDDSTKFMVTKCTGFNTNDKERINGPYLSNMKGKFNFEPRNTPWIKGGREVRLASEEEITWLDACIEAGKFIELENVKRNPEPLPAYVKEYPLTPDDCYFPDKWALKVGQHNRAIIAEFLRDHSYEWYHYKETWEVSPGPENGRYNNYFHYPPTGEPMHSDLKVQEGYTLITTEQFKQFYKTKNFKEDEKRSGSTSTGSIIKICRPNFEIRHSDPIRAVSIRCTKSKISVGG